MFSSFLINLILIFNFFVNLINIKKYILNPYVSGTILSIGDSVINNIKKAAEPLEPIF